MDSRKYVNNLQLIYLKTQKKKILIIRDAPTVLRSFSEKHAFPYHKIH